MIVFDLACACGFTFEGWFLDRGDFESQQQASFIVCPQCGGKEIRKILSPIRFQSSEGYGKSSARQHSSRPVSPEEAEKALATLQKFVVENFEDVGCQLATEAIKMHYGVSEPRNIRGVTTEAEEKKLQEEGINLLKIPLPLKEDKVN